MSGKKGMKKYPAAMKLEAMRLFYEEGKTRAEITDLLAIRDPHRVKAWLKQYRREGVEGFNQPQGRPRKRRDSEAEELKQLRMENALLKKFHTELRTERLAKRNIGSSTIIEENTK
jgi:transposase-like protein